MTDELQHVILDYSEHFLVVNGTRGPVCRQNGQPATHPSGFFRFRSDGYGISEALKGKTFRIVDVACEEQENTVCEPANKAFLEYMEVKETCNQIVASRYEEAKATA